jgi:nucleotide-binding universal stress UspA family protein
MSESGRGTAIRRILVAVDASSHSLSALEAAAELAASLEAELLGLFVEDINLLRLAELPFAQEIGLFSGTRRRLDSQRVERQLQVQARRARQALATVANRAQVRWTFSVRRGQIASELLMAALDADLVILGKTGWSEQGRLGSTALAVLTQGHGPAMILQRGVQLRLPMLVLYDGSRVAQQALAVAAQLAQTKEDSVIVLLLADTMEAAETLREKASEWLGDRGMAVRYRWLSKADAPKLCQMVQQEASGLLVFHRDTPSLQGEELITLLNEIRCPVLLVQ